MTYTCAHARSNGACPHCLGICGCHGSTAILPTSDIVWEVLESQPGFSAELEQARRDIAEGRGIPFSKVKR